MWISTRAQYGLRALIEIGRQHDRPVSLKRVSNRQNISLHYLEQIIANLRRAGFVRSIRGASGGYVLTRAADQISVYDVVVTLEGSLAPVSCVEDTSSCDHENVCGTQDLWFRVDAAVRAVLEADSIASLIAEADRQEQAQLIQLDVSDKGL